jgi:hypothetical protein
VWGGRPQPPPDGLHLVAGDLLGDAQAPPVHPHQQGAHYFRRSRTQAIHRRAQGGAKGTPAVSADPTRPPVLATVRNHAGGPTARAGRILSIGFSSHLVHLRLTSWIYTIEHYSGGDCPTG